MRRLAVLLAISIVAAACSSAGGDVADPTPPTTQAGDAGDAGAVPDGPVAPDFTLALADGGSFTLSQEAKPVYMIFWAEW